MAEPQTPPFSDWEAAYRKHSLELTRVAFLMMGSRDAAEDAVHEVFLRCSGRLHLVQTPGAYLRTAVINECRGQHRRRGRLQSFSNRGGPGVEYEILPEVQFPHETVETLQALEGLSARKRAAVVLRYFVDVPDPEIAEILGCRPATVRSLIRRALIDLRRDLT